MIHTFLLLLPSEPWFSGEQAGLFGGIGGATIGVVCGIFGALCGVQVDHAQLQPDRLAGSGIEPPGNRAQQKGIALLYRGFQQFLELVVGSGLCQEVDGLDHASFIEIGLCVGQRLCRVQVSLQQVPAVQRGRKFRSCQCDLLSGEWVKAGASSSSSAELRDRP